MGGNGNDVYIFDTNDVDAGETISDSGGSADVVAIATSVDFANLPEANLDNIEQIRFSGANQTGTFTGAQLTGETLLLTETAAGTSNLIINVGSGKLDGFCKSTRVPLLRCTL